MVRLVISFIVVIGLQMWLGWFPFDTWLGSVLGHAFATLMLCGMSYGETEGQTAGREAAQAFNTFRN